MLLEQLIDPPQLEQPGPAQLFHHRQAARQIDPVGLEEGFAIGGPEPAIGKVGDEEVADQAVEVIEELQGLGGQLGMAPPAGCYQ